jgi:NAD-dependent DNA ligase
MDRDNLSKEINMLLRHGMIREIYPSVYALTMKGLEELKELDNKKLHRQMLEVIQEVKREGFIK